jgi:hypothetical protein
MHICIIKTLFKLELIGNLKFESLKTWFSENFKKGSLPLIEV